jgi:hypothetical protein
LCIFRTGPMQNHDPLAIGRLAGIPV